MCWLVLSFYGPPTTTTGQAPRLDRASFAYVLSNYAHRLARPPRLPDGLGDPARRPLRVRAALVPRRRGPSLGRKRSVPIAVEMDGGTESLHILGEKLARYAAVGSLTGHRVLHRS